MISFCTMYTKSGTPSFDVNSPLGGWYVGPLSFLTISFVLSPCLAGISWSDWVHWSRKRARRWKERCVEVLRSGIFPSPPPLAPLPPRRHTRRRRSRHPRRHTSSPHPDNHNNINHHSNCHNNNNHHIILCTRFGKARFCLTNNKTFNYSNLLKVFTNNYNNNNNMLRWLSVPYDDFIFIGSVLICTKDLLFWILFSPFSALKGFQVSEYVI